MHSLVWKLLLPLAGILWRLLGRMPTCDLSMWLLGSHSCGSWFPRASDFRVKEERYCAPMTQPQHSQSLLSRQAGA